MRSLALTALITSGAALLASCATPEELAAAQQKAGRQTQTGSNIARSDPAARTVSVTDKDAQDAMLNEIRRVPTQSWSGGSATP
jgi:hypothetical protein